MFFLRGRHAKAVVRGLHSEAGVAQCTDLCRFPREHREVAAAEGGTWEEQVVAITDDANLIDRSESGLRRTLSALATQRPRVSRHRQEIVARVSRHRVGRSGQEGGVGRSRPQNLAPWIRCDGFLCVIGVSVC